MYWSKFWNNKEIVRVVISILTIFILLSIGIALQGDFAAAINTMGCAVAFLVFYFGLCYLMRNNE